LKAPDVVVCALGSVCEHVRAGAFDEFGRGLERRAGRDAADASAVEVARDRRTATAVRRQASLARSFE
jgi:hypothetical protein